MTLKEAYEIFFGKFEGKITKEIIERNFTEETIKREYRKLSRKYHPDLHKENDFDYEELMKQINLAKEKLLLACRPFKNENATPPKSVSNILKDDLEDIEKIIPSYLKLAKYAYELRMYKIKSRLYRNVEYYYKEISECNSPLEIYKSVQEIIDLDKKAKIELYAVRGVYNTLKQMISAKRYDAEYLMRALKNITGDYFNSLDNFFLKIEVESWYKNEEEKDLKKYNDQLSSIKNMKNRIILLLNNSKVINDIFCQAVLNNYAKVAVDNLSQKKSLINRFRILTDYKNMRRRYSSRMFDWQNFINNQVTDIANGKELSEKYLTFVDDELKNILFEEDYELLSDENVLGIKRSKEYRKDLKEYDLNNDKLEKEYRTVLREIKNSIINIKYFLIANGCKESKMLTVPGNMELEDLLTEYQNKAISLYYEIFICYFREVENSHIKDEIEELYYTLYLNEKPGEMDPLRIDVYYSMITREYNKISNFKYNSRVKEKTMRELIKNIKEITSFMRFNKVNVPDNIERRIDDIDKLSLVELYQLNKELDKLIFSKKNTK